MPHPTEPSEDAGNPSITSATAPAVGQPPCSPIAHPELRQIGRKQISNILQDMEKYLAQVSATPTAGTTVQLVPLTASIESELSLSPLAIGALKGAMKVSEVRDEMINTYLESRVGASSENLTATNLERLIKRAVQFNVREVDL